jgi:hypothetical protein
MSCERRVIVGRFAENLEDEGPEEGVKKDLKLVLRSAR